MRKIINEKYQKQLMDSYVEKFQSILEKHHPPLRVFNLTRYVLVIMLICRSATATATASTGSEIIYGYDESNHEIYAIVDHEIRKMKFMTDYENNPSCSFDFFLTRPQLFQMGVHCMLLLYIQH